MSKKALTVLWWMFALFAFTFGLFGFLRTRGLEPPIDMLGIFNLEPAEVAVLALPIALAAYSGLLYLTRVWCKETGGKSWGSRVPVPYFDATDIDPDQRGGKAFQGAVIALFLVVPMLVLLLIGVQYLRGSIYFNVKRGPTELLGMEWLGHFSTSTLYEAMQGRHGFFRFGTADGPQYYPVLTWVYLFWLVGLAFFLAGTLSRIFRTDKDAV